MKELRTSDPSANIEPLLHSLAPLRISVALASLLDDSKDNQNQNTRYVHLRYSQGCRQHDFRQQIQLFYRPNRLEI